MAELNQVLASLRMNAAELRRRGVLHAGVFGSVARGSGNDKSDVDILLTFTDDEQFGLLEYVRLERYLTGIVGAPVDLADRQRLKPLLRNVIEREVVDAF
jgi:predicted nucleotidyltransferase